jgi:predicted NBD/HSP70 family sugar kinase
MEKTCSIIVLDIGGTHIRAGILANTSKPEFITRTPNKRGEILTEVFQIIENVIQANGLRKFQIVVGCPGLVSCDGKITAALYWPASGIHLGKEIRKKFSCKAFVLNDANLQAHAIAESTTNAIYMTFGTGVGGAVILNNQVVLGSNGFTGEYGHISVDDDGALCKCGQNGCLDTFTSGYWLMQRLGDKWWEHPDESRVNSAIRAAGNATAKVVNSASTMLDIQSVVLAGHIVRQDEFISSYEKALHSVNVTVKSQYFSESWPLAVAGAFRLTRDKGEIL